MPYFLISDSNYHRTKCCYGLTMDLLDNIATELSFEFHLYVVRDQLFGSKQQRDIKDFFKASGTRTKRHTHNENGNGDDGGSTVSQQTTADHDINDDTQNSKYDEQTIEVVHTFLLYCWVVGGNTEHTFKLRYLGMALNNKCIRTCDVCV